MLKIPPHIIKAHTLTINFLSLLREYSVNDPNLKEHLEKPLQKNATYVRMQSQNEMIDVIGHHTIQANIIDEIKAAGFHSIMVDEVTASNDEVMSLCVRFIDDKNNIREEFLEFIQVKRITGQALADAIFKFYKETGLNISHIRGQCFDGAANMAGAKKGLSAIILNQNPQAVYMHCNSHILNLSIVSACKDNVIQAVLARMTQVAIFINYSPKRENLLEHIVARNVEGGQRRKILVGLCKTRWTERNTAYEHFFLAFPFLVTCFEIINGTHGLIDSYESAYTEDWSAESKKDATTHLNAMCNFGFIVGLVSVYRLLYPLQGTCQKLQGRTIDIVKAFDEIESVKSDIQATRNDIDNAFTRIYQHSVRLSEQVGVEPSIPRIAKRQSNRANTPADNPEEYYRRTLAIPLLDNIMTELNTRFTNLSLRASKLLFLVPDVMCTLPDNSTEFNEIVEMYKEDLVNPDVIDIELSVWRRKWLRVDSKDRPSSLAKSLGACDRSRLPNLYVLLKIASCLPVTSCECERSFSVLRRLRPWLRASMTTPRLSSLALMNIHYGHEVNYKDIVKKFLELHPRRIDISNLLFE